MLDAVLTVEWDGGGAEFAVEAKTRSTPRAFRNAALQIEDVARRTGLPPLLVVPHLREEQLDELTGRDVSGIDLGGNGVVTIPGKLLVYRTGRPNRFPRGQGIADAYRGAAALVGRTFLVEPTFRSLGGLHEAVLSRGGQVSLSLVSKACKALEEDLMIERTGRGRRTALRLLRPDALLDRLRDAFVPARVNRRAWARCRGKRPDLRSTLATWADRSGVRVCRTALSSAPSYATAAVDPVPSYYCSDVAAAARDLLGHLFVRMDAERSAFADAEFRETVDAAVYFDARPDLTASPVQTYLELACGDSRDAEAAEDVRGRILGEVRRAIGRPPREVRR